MKSIEYGLSFCTSSNSSPESSAGCGGSSSPGDPARESRTEGDECYPVDCFPEPVRSMILEVSRFHRTPCSLAGSCVLGIGSASIGSGLQVEIRPGLVSKGNLYISTGAASGTGKTSTYREIAGALLNWELERVENWNRNIRPGVSAGLEICESQIAGIKKQLQRESSILDQANLQQRLVEARTRLEQLNAQNVAPTLTVEDVTTEKLAVRLAECGETLASLSSDAGQIVSNLLGRYVKNARVDDNIYLKAYLGDPVRVDRINRPSVALHNPTLSILWLTQPDKIATMISSPGLIEGGLIPRFLLHVAQCEPQPWDDSIQGISECVRGDYETKIREILGAFRHVASPHSVRLSSGARRAIRDFYNDVVEMRKGAQADLSSFLARWAENAGRIALCLHAMRHGRVANQVELEEQTMRDAITLMRWYGREQLVLLEANAEGDDSPPRGKVPGKVLVFLSERPHGATEREILRACFRSMTTNEAKAILSAMVQKGELVHDEVVPARGGHAVKMYRLAG